MSQYQTTDAAKIILIIDDNPVNLRVLSEHLQQRGFMVVVAQDGEEGLERAQLVKPDLILLDVLMPGINGLETCRRLKACEATREIPVIFKTSLIDTATRMAGFEAGGVDYVTSPIQIEEVMARVQTHVTLHTVKRRLEQQNLDLQQEMAVRERTEKELEEARAELEDRVQKRTAELRAEIAERRRAELALRASEQRYRALFHDNPSMYFTLRSDGVVAAVNQFGASQLGYTVDELEGRSILDIVYEEDRAVFSKELKSCLETPSQLLGCQSRKIRKDGALRWVEEFGQAVVGADGSPMVLLVCHDITARKQAEEERSGLLEQLQQAQKLESVGRLAAGVAHDFNNVLAVINGYSEILLHNPELEEVVQHQIQEILSAGERGVTLTRQMLAFSRKQVLQLKVLSLNHVVEDTDRMLRRIIGEDVEVETILDPSLKPVKADPSQIEQVLLNFCVNARDAMPKGGKLTIETANVDIDAVQAARRVSMIPGRYVRLSVTDSGCGMDKETLSHVFEPFFSTKGPDKGTGLGLATVYGIVTQSGGHVEVCSELGHGSTFTVYLPTADASLAEPREQEPAPEEAANGTETILLVEDVAALRLMTRELLQRSGYTVLEAEDGEQAMRVAENYAEEIALLLTDVVLPKIQGPALAKSLMQQRQGLKVMFMSGYPDDALADTGVPSLRTTFLQKPFPATALARKVRNLLDSKEEAAA